MFFVHADEPKSKAFLKGKFTKQMKQPKANHEARKATVYEADQPNYDLNNLTETLLIFSNLCVEGTR